MSSRGFIRAARQGAGAVADAAHGLDHGGIVVGREFAAEALDVNIDEIRAGIEVVVPDVFADLGAGKRLAGRAQEVGEQGELARGEPDQSAGAERLARDEIYGEFAMLEEGEGGAGGAAGDGVEARHEFIDVEGFNEVIVGAEVEAFEALVERAAGGDEHDGDGETALAELAQNAEAVAAGDHDIEDEGVVGAGGGEGEGIVAVIAEIDGDRLRFETFAHEVRELLVVFEHQDFHAPASTGAVGGEASGQR